MIDSDIAPDMQMLVFSRQEIRKKLGQKLLVSDLLIKPVQRIMRYQLLLREILKSTERMGDGSRAIGSALHVMIEVPRQANDMMNVGRIKDLPTNVHQLGELKLQDMLSVSEPIGKETKDVKEVEKKLKERRVFLFQQAIVFCEEIPAKDKYSSPNYIYKCDLKVSRTADTARDRRARAPGSLDQQIAAERIQAPERFLSIHVRRSGRWTHAPSHLPVQGR